MKTFKIIWIKGDFEINIFKLKLHLGKKKSPMPFFLRNLKMGGRGEGEKEGQRKLVASAK